MNISGYVRATASDFAEALRRHTPRGVLWLFRDESRLGAFLLGSAAELARLQGRLIDLLDTETDWLTTDELLADWERVAGLPDPCNDNPPTDPDVRRQILKAKMTATGGQSPSYFKNLADQITGEDCTITDLVTPWVWDVSVPNNDVDVFQAGDPAGTPLAQYSPEVTDLLCQFAAIKPKHTRITYTFPDDDPAT